MKQISYLTTRPQCGAVPDGKALMGVRLGIDLHAVTSLATLIAWVESSNEEDEFTELE